jgi:hypothetical protein
MRCRLTAWIAALHACACLGLHAQTAPLVAPTEPPALIALRTVLLHQFQCLRCDGGLNHFTHKSLVGLLGLNQTALSHRFCGKPHVSVDIQATRVVVGIKSVIALLKTLSVNPTQVQGELTPRLVGVQGQQGLV